MGINRDQGITPAALLDAAIVAAMEELRQREASVDGWLIADIMPVVREGRWLKGRRKPTILAVEKRCDLMVQQGAFVVTADGDRCRYAPWLLETTE